MYQTTKLVELLSGGCNELWQAEVTYVLVLGHGWWYAVTVIDDYSRDLLVCHFKWNDTAAEVNRALDTARADAQRLHGGFEKVPLLVTDNESSFMAHRIQEHIRGLFTHVRIAYRTPTQLGLLERFHQTLKSEEVRWRLYDSPGHARTSLDEFRQRYNRVRPTGHWFRYVVMR